jgi:MFS family permease
MKRTTKAPHSFFSTKRNALSRLGICLMISATLMSSGLPSPLYIIYQKQLSLSNTTVNILFSVYAIGVLMTLMLIIKLGDKVKDRRQLIISSALLLTLSALIMIFANNIYQLISGRLISGIATGSLLGSANAALLELHKRKDPKASALLATIALTAGSGIGPSISGFFISRNFHPTISSYIPLIVLALLSIPLVMLTKVPVPLIDKKQQNSSQEEAINPLKSIPFLVAALTIISGWAVGAVFMSSGQLFTTKLALVTNVFLAAALMTTFQFSAGLGQLLSSKFNQLTAVISGMSLCTLAQTLMCIFALCSMTRPYEICSLFAGLGYGIAFVGATGIINSHAPQNQRAGFISAYYVAGYLLGNAIPAVSVGAFIDHFSLSTAITLFTTWIILIFALLLYSCHKMALINKTGNHPNN